MINEPNDLVFENAVIQSAEINADRGVLTAWINLNYGGGSVQGFGGCVLHLPEQFANYELKSIAGHFIWRVMEIAGVKQWGDLAGKTVRVRHSEHRIWEIGHIIKNDWFCPERDFNPEALKNKEQDNEEKTNGY